MIRNFKIEDLEEVNKLLKDLDYQLTSESLNNKFLKVLIYYDKRIKGVLVYQDLIDIITIDYIIVLEDYRNKDIATSLIKELETKCNNINNITLEVRESNKIAINFYEKQGFRKAAKRRHYYNNEDGILMIKELR